jgi:allantoin racemase
MQPETGVKILWLSDTTLDQMTGDPSEQEILFANMLEHARDVARPTTEFVLDFIEVNTGEAFTPYLRYVRSLMAVEVNDRVRQAEAEGFDAAFPGMCFGEYFLQDARQAVSMPVVGPAESSMMLAQLLGSRFAVVTVTPNHVYTMTENIRLHGWENRAIRNRPVRSWKSETIRWALDAYDGRPARLIEEFDRQAQLCVDDGADVVICGCNPYGAALAKAGYNEVSGTGVPVVTALAAMIKQAEMLVDLRRSLGLTKTEAVVGPYRSTPPHVLEDLDARGVRGPQRRQLV